MKRLRDLRGWNHAWAAVGGTVTDGGKLTLQNVRKKQGEGYLILQTSEGPSQVLLEFRDPAERDAVYHVLASNAGKSIGALGALEIPGS